MAGKFSGGAEALCGEALNFLDLFGSFWGNAKKNRATILHWDMIACISQKA